MFTLKKPRLQNQAPLDYKALDDLPELKHALSQSPYLTRLCRMRPEILDRLSREFSDDVVDDIIKSAANIRHDTLEADAMRTLRNAKADLHVALALHDLACAWDWNIITEVLSDFADAAIDTALRLACAQAANRGWIDWADPEEPVPGLFILALGKLGAKELNYSSDVDLVALFDPELFPSGKVTPGDAARRIIQAMTRILETITEHGYVVRVDLRLRPDPRSTPVAVSTRAAEIYYEHRGQNWERMAYIKSRASAGDLASAETFLASMEPFVWRRHLDYWALEDIRAIKQQIHSEGGHHEMSDPEFDVKLGKGGIREIEFFAQTQQLIHGGRVSELRNRRTIETLKGLTELGHVSETARDELTNAYGLLRSIEHRIQMLNDEHTHTLSADPAIRDRVAALCGYDDLAEFDADIEALRRQVNRHFTELFKETGELSGIKGNLVFTGVDEDPGTLKTLSELGFTNPTSIIQDFQAWHRGGIRATKTPRGRQLLSSMERRLFQLLSETGNPDAAYEGLKTFLSGLSAGIQTLSLLASNPALLEDIISIFSVAPRMAKDLGHRPELLEALLDGGFQASLSEDACGHRGAIAQISQTLTEDFEGAINEVRREFRDEHFRIRYKLLHDPKAIYETGPAFSKLADACIRALEPVAIHEAERKLGAAPGRWVICGLGKLGSEDLMADSDLDLMVVFEADKGGANGFYTRATQRMIAALSAQTEEGFLYEADMQLRPSGRAGPVAVKLSAFSDYYRKEAWTWELMALTRLRVVAGDESLKAALEADLSDILASPRNAQKLCEDAWDMRRRLLKDRPAKHAFDFKLARGGMIDIEFLTQIAQLLRPDADWGSRKPLDVIGIADEVGLFDASETACLRQSYARYSALTALQRTALQGPTLGEDWPLVLQKRAAATLDMADFGAVMTQLERDKNVVWDIFCDKLDPQSADWSR